jgi:ABC-type sugar transport system ATPase subunit
VIQVDGLARAFNSVPAVRDVSFTVGAGEIHGLCGHNGAGKSTVVKMLSGQLAPDSGRILIDDVPVEFGSPQAAPRAGVARVAQGLSVVPAVTLLGKNPTGGGSRWPDAAGCSTTWAWTAWTRTSRCRPSASANGS